MANNALIKTTFFTSLALIAFAANSVLGRLALKENAIDPSSFTAVRLLSGAVVLLIIISINRRKSNLSTKGSWSASLMLFIYAITFSFAYLSLDTGTGALILFAAVQITMILLSLITGTRLHLVEWVGVATAFTGFVYLILPGLTTPSLGGFILMTISGVAWGLYTLKGRDSKNPPMDTAYNFYRTIPLVCILVIITFKTAHYSLEGLLLALLSGGITSGLGYTIWYIALGGLSSTSAAVLQLLVPVIATAGGILFISEAITTRLIISATIILGGILMVLLGQYYFANFKTTR